MRTASCERDHRAGHGAPLRRRTSSPTKREFAALAPAWGRLYRRCGAATPFQSHAWLHSWWLSYGAAGRLRIVVVVRDGGRTARRRTADAGTPPAARPGAARRRDLRLRGRAPRRRHGRRGGRRRSPRASRDGRPHRADRPPRGTARRRGGTRLRALARAAPPVGRLRVPGTARRLDGRTASPASPPPRPSASAPSCAS